MQVLISALAGGFVGTLVLTTVLRSASEIGLTRMDLPFLLGTVVTEDRRWAKVLGYLFHFVLGLLFALLYGTFFVVIGRSSWWLGALLGALHAAFVGTVVANVLLPALHPRIGTPDSAANDIALIEPPGFLMINYGRNTFVVTLVAHIAYGAIVGGVVRV
jgi:hypothetical protein